MRWLFLIVVMLTLVASPRAEAVQPDEILADAALEARKTVAQCGSTGYTK